MDIKRLHSNKKNKTVGRGGKRGKTSGKGTKGQNARAGRKFRPALRDQIKKLPKLRGYRFSSRHLPKTPVNLSSIEEYFKVGDVVSKETLLNANLIRRVGGKIGDIKILGTGDLTKKLSFVGVEVSAIAKEKIEKALGEIK